MQRFRLSIFVLFLFCSLVSLTLLGCSGGSSTTPPPPPPPTAATPTFSPASGAYTQAQSVAISTATTGATIYYTTDGTTPTTASTVYASAISVSSTETLKAIAVETGYTNSAVASATYTISLPVAATPGFSPVAGTYTSAQSVAISTATTGATIYYTTDGTTPTTASSVYASAISVSSTETLKAIAVETGYTNSAVASATYTISLPVAATPSFSPKAGTYSSDQSVTIKDTQSGVSIYYTTDGATPTTSSSLYSAAIPVNVDTTIKAIATATGYTNSTTASASYVIAGPSVNVTLTTHDQTKLLATQPAKLFTLTQAGSNKILVDETLTYQPIEGFGAAFTDSAAWLLYTQAQPAQYTSTMNDLFTRTGNGIGLSFMRIPMGASDIARSVYSFDDQTPPNTDPTLSDFSITHDKAYVIPVIQRAKALNPDLKLMANPWSPPGWMKSTDTMMGGTLLSADYTAFANYFVDYLNAYSANGLPIDYISLQNEPLNNTTAYPAMGMDDVTQTTILGTYILPAFTASNITTQVFVYDHNWDTPSYPEYVLGNSSILASPLVAGTAWHGYAGTPGAQQTVQNMFPTKGTWQTEHSGGTWVSDQFTSDFVEITQVMRNSARSYVKWSLALDENLGPNLGELNQGYGGCTTCTPIVTVNSSTGAVTNDIEYYTLGQFSKFILPGAQRIYSSNANSIVSSAYINTDGSKVLVCFNNSSAAQSFQVQWGIGNFTYTLPSLGAVTFTWSGTQNGTTTVDATSEIQASSFTTESGLETEATSDTTGGYDLGYVTPGAYVEYQNVDFGNGVTSVNVRTASDGVGSTLNFYLDSMSGSPIATVPLPVTGGWQTWTTVTGNVSGAKGVHTLYAVFQGSGSMSNLNWFQFQ